MNNGLKTALFNVQSLIGLRDCVCILLMKDTQKYREEDMEQKAITHF